MKVTFFYATIKIGGSMQEDLKIIKNRFGEKMMHLCRELFPTILEHPGVLSDILLSHFGPSKHLYEDIVGNTFIDEDDDQFYREPCDFTDKFKTFVYSIYDTEAGNYNKTTKSPRVLLSEAGYELFECKTEDEIQYFKKYYVPGEELCTFKGGRLNSCYVFFAVKKDVDKIRRNDFTMPDRQDRYGTSVISIQFTRDDSNILSIKNRYNHTVSNPDATFSNNLDNIIEGLTNSFEKEYGLRQKFRGNLNLPGYVLASDGKYYKYSYEENNIYYCPDNIIIDNFKVKEFPKERYIVMNHYVLDMKTGEIKNYDSNISDSFCEVLNGLYKVKINLDNGLKKVIFEDNGENAAVITLNNTNQIIGYENLKLEQVSDDFMTHSNLLEKINMPHLKCVGNKFLSNNERLEIIELPELENVGDGFVSANRFITKVIAPKLKLAGNNFMESAEIIEEISFPELESVGRNFFLSGRAIKKVYLPSLKVAGNKFLSCNEELTSIDLPEAEEIGRGFLIENKNIVNNINMPKLKYISSYRYVPISKNEELEAKLEEIATNNSQRSLR